MQKIVDMAQHSLNIFHNNQGLLTLLFQFDDGNIQGLRINQIKKQSHKTTCPTQTLIETSRLLSKASYIGKYIDNCDKKALNSIKPPSSRELAYSPHFHIQQ